MEAALKAIAEARRREILRLVSAAEGSAGDRTELGAGMVAGGEFGEIDEARRLVMTFGWEGNEQVPPGSSRVEITLEPDGDETIVRLLHDGLADGEAEQHGDGWDHYLAR